MICKFCGLNNSDDSAFCSRCGSPLKEVRQPASVSTPPVSVVDDDKKTMRMDKSANDPVSNVSAGTCQCGYPILPGMQVCPKCHTPLNGAALAPNHSSMGADSESKKTVVISKPNNLDAQEAPINRRTVPDQEYPSARRTERFVAEEPNEASAKRTERFVAGDQNGSSAKKTERFVPNSQNDDKVSKKTVNIFQQAPRPELRPVEEPPHFTLEPLARENESACGLEKHTFDVANVVLNRQNTEPGNNSITSQQQAIMTFENGKWYIEDKSFFKTTFIRVTKKTELQEGDIIVLGNREFKFSKK